MHPAASIISFTTASGLGFGLLAYLGLGYKTDSTSLMAFCYFALGFCLSVGGLLSSLGHLGRPERAWKALSQWRSSWLSREGCLAIGALLCMAIFAFGRVFNVYDVPFFGYLGAGLSVATVYATSMIYAQLKTVPRWNHWSTPVLFILISLTGGALLTGLVIPAGIGMGVIVLFQIWACIKGIQGF